MAACPFHLSGDASQNPDAWIIDVFIVAAGATGRFDENGVVGGGVHRGGKGVIGIIVFKIVILER